MSLVPYKKPDGLDGERRPRVAASREVSEYAYYLALTAWTAELGSTFIDEALGPLARVVFGLLQYSNGTGIYARVDGIIVFIRV